MTFSISFIEDKISFPYDDPQTAAAIGMLVLGDHQERFRSSLSDWSKMQYVSQWESALNLILTNVDSKAALITTYGNPRFSTHLEWWPMYRSGDSVYVQNHLLFYEDLPAPFDVSVPFRSLKEREIFNEEGRCISEWKVGLSAVRSFIRGIKN